MLALQIELPRPRLLQIVARMIHHDELRGCTVDHTTATLSFNSKANRLHYLVLQYAEKLSSLVDGTERICDYKFEPVRLVDEARQQAR